MSDIDDWEQIDETQVNLIQFNQLFYFSKIYVFFGQIFKIIKLPATIKFKRLNCTFCDY